MTVNDILEEICKRGSIYDEIINNLLNPRLDLKPELISEIAISFLENKDKIEEVYKQGYFKYYFINVVKNQVHSSTSTFHKNVRIQDYKTTGDINDINDETDIEFKKLFEERLDLVNKIYKEIKKDWFQSTIWDEYFVKNKTHRQIEQDWGIDHVLSWHTIKKLKNKIINEIKTKNH